MENITHSEPIQVEATKITTGTIRFMGKGFNNPTPVILAKVTKSLRYFCVGLITMLAATDLFSPPQVKITTFLLGVFILALGAVDLAVGVESEKQEKKENE